MSAFADDDVTSFVSAFGRVACDSPLLSSGQVHEERDVGQSLGAGSPLMSESVQIAP
jgi:hypothetical protein